MTSGRTSGTEYFCSFCSEGEQQAGRLIAGPGSVYICENCVKRCAAIIGEDTQAAETLSNPSVDETAPFLSLIHI